MGGGHSVRAEEREVFDIVRRFDLLSVDRIVEAHRFACSAGDAEAKREGFPSRGATVALGSGKFSHSGVEEPSLIGARFFAVTGVGRSEITISQVFLKDGVGDLAVES